MNDIRKTLIENTGNVIDPLVGDRYYIEDEDQYWILPEVFDSAIVGLSDEAIVYDSDKVSNIMYSDEYDGYNYPTCSESYWGEILAKYDDLTVDSSYRSLCPVFIELF